MRASNNLDGTADSLTVGIDLGTTHTVVGFAAPSDSRATLFQVPQLVTASDIESLPLLPSFLYAPAPDEPFADPFGDAPWVIGSYARQRGKEVPGRLVLSAKSWLSQPAVDRKAAILPWGAGIEESLPKISPVEASERILRHVRSVWDAAFEAHPLHRQSIVLTVPASFDEAARELTVLAAERAGLAVRLLEEPQAAFYDFIAQVGQANLSDLLLRDRSRALVLVCDVGGGTTDLTLIEARRAESGDVELERVAVGRHLLLGGDNIDLTLAHRVEARLVAPPERLAPARFAELVIACRSAKEKLLGHDPPESMPIRIASGGSSLVGSTLSAEVTRSEVEAIVFEGFLPEVPRDARPSRGRAGLLAFGLPYEQDAAITRHIASFFARHSDRPGPDALLLNGGLFRAARAAERLSEVVRGWSDHPLTVLPHSDPDLAVARGAVLYGLSLRGRGPRIGGGAPHGFYVAVDAGGERRALSVLPRGAREGERHVAKSRGLSLRVGQPVRFELFTLDATDVHAPGVVVPFDEEAFVALPPVTATFGGAEIGAQQELRVALEGELSAIGTVELGCVELEPQQGAQPRRFRLAFDLRATQEETDERRAPKPSTPAPSGRAPRLGQAEELVARVFGKSRPDVKARETRDLVRELERLLGERRTWTLETNRALFDCVAADPAARRRSEDHERVFWMLTGYCLRPGFGHPRDPARVGLLAELFDGGVTHFQQTRVFQQFWIAWRRIAAGLPEPAQTHFRDALDPFLAPAERKLKKPKQLRPLAPEELLELASWLERVPVPRRAELGRWILDKTWTSKDPRLWAALGRLGSRIPAYASAHYVLPPLVVESWLDHLLRERWEQLPTATRVAYDIARVTNDRARDVSDAMRTEVARRLDRASAPPEWSRAVREFVPSDAAERADRFGEDLPVGLRLIDTEN